MLSVTKEVESDQLQSKRYEDCLLHRRPFQCEKGRQTPQNARNGLNMLPLAFVSNQNQTGSENKIMNHGCRCSKKNLTNLTALMRWTVRVLPKTAQSVKILSRAPTPSEQLEVKIQRLGCSLSNSSCQFLEQEVVDK